jgi:cobalt-zinc-cadmium efflux system protein
MSHAPSRSFQRRTLWIALVLNAGYMAIEIVGGVLFNSLALVADGAHMLSDVGGLAIALLAHSLLARPATARHTYGLQRSEVLGALVNGVALVAVVGWLVFEAFERLASPQPIQGGAVLVIGSLGLLVNLGSAALLKRAQGSSLNVRGAFLHMASDAWGSVAVIVGGAAVVVWGATWADPLASLVVAALILWVTWNLLRDTVHVLMEGAPAGMDAREIERALSAFEGVRTVHHLHLWNLASDVPALSAHVVLDDDRSLHEAQLTGERLRAILRHRFGIEHATLELECHPCAEVTDRSHTAVG